MVGPVPQSSVISIGAACLCGVIIPIALYIYFKVKHKADTFPFVMGCLVFFVFVMILESSINNAVFTSSAGDTLRNNAFLYALYGGVMAALFEETGRFLMLRLVKKKKGLRDVNSLMYGAGHGGFEALMLLGVSMFGNLSYAAAINSGRIEEITNTLSGDTLDQLISTLNVLVETPSYTYLFSIAERIFAVALQISLSVLVWFAVSGKGKGYLLAIAYGIHAAVDFFTALMSGLGVPVPAIEAAVGVMTVLVCIFAKKTWKSEHIPEPDEEEAPRSPYRKPDAPTL